MRIFINILIAVLFCNSLFAQTDSLTKKDIVEMSIEELLNLKITVASSKAMTQRESPGIVSVITADEIQKSGARELKDVLHMIPGITYSADLLPIYYPNVRGNNTASGKVLIMIDGLELTDGAFGLPEVYDRVSVDQIKRIEVIRGPGSAMYGGMAEYGVINIITYSPEDISGLKINAMGGISDGLFTRYQGGVSVGAKKNDLEFKLDAFYHDYLFSTEDEFWHMGFNSKYSLKDKKYHENPYSFNGMLKYKGLNVNLYHVTNTTTNYQLPLSLDKLTHTDQATVMKVKYNIEASEKLTISPFFIWRKNKPYNWSVDDDSLKFVLGREDIENAEYNKLYGGINTGYDISKDINIIAGLGYYNEDAYFDNALYYIDSTISFNTLSAYVQILFTNKIANITVGTRYDNNEVYGDAFAPRIALTKTINDFHLKALYSRAYRSPLVGEILSNSELFPEKTDVVEFELGYKFTDKSIFAVNFFDITTNDAITYIYDNLAAAGRNINEGKSGSTGVECEIKYKGEKMTLSANYSYAFINKNENLDYEILADDAYVLGIPNQSANIYTSFKIDDNIFITPSYHMKGDSYAYYPDGTQDPLGLVTGQEPNLKLFGSQHFVNVNILFEDLYTKGLDLSLGIYNLLDEPYEYHVNYDYSGTSYPGLGTEFVIKLKYHFN